MLLPREEALGWQQTHTDLEYAQESHWLPGPKPFALKIDYWEGVWMVALGRSPYKDFAWVCGETGSMTQPQVTAEQP